MYYNENTRTVHMDMIDLQRCGFSHDKFYNEIRMSGASHPAAAQPEKLVVDFQMGAIKLFTNIM